MAKRDAIPHENFIKTTKVSLKRQHSNDEEQVVKEARIESTTTKSFSIFTPKAAIQWVELGTLLVGVYNQRNLEGRSKIAAFDLDSTLISVKGTHSYPKDEYDWKWWREVVPKRLKQLYEEGYKIVIFTNQGGLEASRKSAVRKQRDFMNKIKHIAHKLDVPFQIYAATAHDKYRKPMTGAWQYFADTGNNGVVIDMENSFFVGDAAGRSANWKPGALKDWADTDRKLAENLGLKFYTPEEFFEHAEPVPYSYTGFNVRNMPQDVPLFTPDTTPLLPADGLKEIVILVGYPASGKSTFAKRHLVSNKYVYVNQDTLKTKLKCLQACEDALQKGKSVVIDNTNPDYESRKSFIDIAKKYGIPVRCFWFTTTEDLAKHNNMYRAVTCTDGTRMIPKVAFNTYNSRFREPQLAEGFEEIKRVNFVFDGTDEERRQWQMWYL